MNSSTWLSSTGNSWKRSSWKRGPAICRRALWCAAACWIAASASHADWLVTRAGERVETEGPWEVKGQMVVFTQPGGTLSSLRVSEVDLEASEEATAETARTAAPPEAPAPTLASARMKGTRVITTEDVGAGVPGAQSGDLLVESLRDAHQYQDVSLAMGLVNWQAVPDGARQSIQTQFEWMMERRIRTIRFVETNPDELDDEELQQLQDDVVYEPGGEVAGTIEIDFIPEPDQAESSLSFEVGSQLGFYFLAAPREVEE